MGGFDDFFADNYDQVVRSLTLAVGDRARAEDAAQEAFAKAYRRWSSVASMERPVGWVLVVAMNQMKRWIKRADREFDSSPTAAADHAEAIALTASIRDALEVLPPRQRAAVVLRYLCDLPNADVAKALGCATGTIKSTLHAALKQLRVELEDDEDEEVSHAG